MKVEEGARRESRLHYIDHLRTSLVALVVVHHVALVYGAVAPFYYVEPPQNDSTAFSALLLFVLANQAWFMGALFLLAGYFTSGSFERKGPVSFLADRFLRLGIPLVIFVFVLNPIASLGVFFMPRSITGISGPPDWSAYPNMLGMGPMWFVALLLVFDLGYVAWRATRRSSGALATTRGTWPGLMESIALIVVLAGASFVWRMAVPLGREILGFPTLAYLPQYLAFFVIGVAASGSGRLRRITGAVGSVGVAAVVVAGVLLLPLAVSGRMFSLEITPALSHALGNGRWQSLVYSLWDSITAVGMCLVLLTFFRRWCDRDGRLGRFLSRHSYAVYVIHIPVLVFLAVAMRGVDLAALPKFGLLSAITIPVCFLAAFVLLKVPLISRIL